MRDARLEVRRLAADDAGASALATAAAVHGVYVRNALAAGERDGLVFFADGEAAAVAWFGPRGNLVLIAGERLAGAGREIAAHVLAAPWPWRIAMGPAGLVDALRDRLGRPALVHRDQVYYTGDAGTAVSEHARDDVRRPEPGDRERLARATLQLNESDLNIPPARVDRRWLYGTIDERLRDGTTRVLGPVGGIWCKLDFGSDGPGGRVLEGVFTFPERRGRGLCTELVATSLRDAPGAVSLHVAEHNRAARRAYERAGMLAVDRCRLLLVT